MYDFSQCNLCPRRCGANRLKSTGFCGVGASLRVSRVSRHRFEEPCLSGTRGSGTVFFSGCQMHCAFCQNRELSFGGIGEEIGVSRLSDLFLQLQEVGVHNINLVTPTHFTPQICEALAAVKSRLHIPVVWNSSGYERPETLEMTRGLADIYLPDFKYVSPEIAAKYSACPDYAARAAEALSFMYEMLGPCRKDGDGMLQRGVLVRHLCLPGCRKDSVAVLHRIADTVPTDGILLGLMAQYTPSFYVGEDKTMRRRVTTFEYESVRKVALELGFDGYMQSPNAATEEFTPHFTENLTVDLR